MEPKAGIKPAFPSRLSCVCHYATLVILSTLPVFEAGFDGFGGRLLYRLS